MLSPGHGSCRQHLTNDLKAKGEPEQPLCCWQSVDHEVLWILMWCVYVRICTVVLTGASTLTCRHEALKWRILTLKLSRLYLKYLRHINVCYVALNKDSAQQSWAPCLLWVRFMSSSVFTLLFSRAVGEQGGRESVEEQSRQSARWCSSRKLVPMFSKSLCSFVRVGKSASCWGSDIPLKSSWNIPLKKKTSCEMKFRFMIQG